MNRHLEVAFATSVLVVGLIAVPCAHASGFMNDAIGARAGGAGSAFVATADDASALFHNPAGAARLQGLNVYGGLGPLLTKTDMEGAAPFPGLGSQSRSRDRLLIAPHVFVTRPLRDGIVWGLSLTQPYRHATDWYAPDEFAGRYLATRIDLEVTTLTPTVAVELAPRVSVGGGLMLSRTELRWDRRVPFLVPDAVSGVIDLAEETFEGTNDVGIGFTVGVLLDRDTYRIGAMLRSGLDATVEGDVGYAFLGPRLDSGVDLEPLTPADHTAEAELSLPVTARIGVARQLTENTWVNVDAIYTRWSSFEGFALRHEASMSDLDTGQTLDLDDTIGVAAGVAYAAGEKLRLRTGYRFVPTPLGEADSGPLWVDSQHHVAALGLGYAYEAWTFDLSQSLAFHTKETVRDNAFDFDANYEQTGWAFALSLGYNRY
jgi:long-subunit fatty acid transport protein